MVSKSPETLLGKLQRESCHQLSFGPSHQLNHAIGCFIGKLRVHVLKRIQVGRRAMGHLQHQVIHVQFIEAAGERAHSPAGIVWPP